MADIKELIAGAVDKLDTKDDSHWTADGVPKMDVMQRLTEVKDLTRAQLNDAVPGLTRQSLEALRKPPEEAPKPPETPQAPDVKSGGSEPPEAPELAQTAEEKAEHENELKRELEHILQRINAGREHVRDVNAEIDKLHKKYDEVAKELEQADNGSNSDAIRSYIESSHVARAKRAGVAPIDAALRARKRQPTLHKPTRK